MSDLATNDALSLPAEPDRRAAVAALPRPVTPHPIGEQLPGMFADNDFVQRWCDGLDEVLGPALVMLDCLESYFDPVIAPADFLAWLAGWVGIAVDRQWPEARMRSVIAHATDLYRWQGTVRGVAAHVALVTGVNPVVTDSGGTVWSASPDGPLPGSPRPEVFVRLATPVAAGPIEAVVRAAAPAHVLCRVETG